MHTQPARAADAFPAVLSVQGGAAPRTFRVMYVPPLAVRRTTNRRQVEGGMSLEAATTKAAELNATMPNHGHFGCPYYEVAPDIKR